MSTEAEDFVAVVSSQQPHGKQVSEDVEAACSKGTGVLNQSAPDAGRAAQCGTVWGLWARLSSSKLVHANGGYEA